MRGWSGGWFDTDNPMDKFMRYSTAIRPSSRVVGPTEQVKRKSRQEIT